MQPKTRKWFPLLLIFIILIVDQSSKIIAVNTLVSEDNTDQIVEVIGDLLRFQYVENTGMAFGILSDVQEPYNHVIFITLTLIAIIFVIFYFRNVLRERWIVRTAFAMIIGGAFGNLLDRLWGHIVFYGEWKLFYGRVVDFIDVGIGPSAYERWPTFNIADISITVGVIVLIFVLLFRRNQPLFQEQAKKKEEEKSNISISDQEA